MEIPGGLTVTGMGTNPMTIGLRHGLLKPDNVLAYASHIFCIAKIEGRAPDRNLRLLSSTREVIHREEGTDFPQTMWSGTLRGSFQSGVLELIPLLKELPSRPCSRS